MKRNIKKVCNTSLYVELLKYVLPFIVVNFFLIVSFIHIFITQHLYSYYRLHNVIIPIHVIP